jgi:hypothetical protein
MRADIEKMSSLGKVCVWDKAMAPNPNPITSPPTLSECMHRIFDNRKHVYTVGKI